MRTVWTKFRLWLARVLRGWAESVVPTTGTLTAGGPPLTPPWDGVGPKHEVWLSSDGVTRSFKSGAEATAFYKWVVDHREPQSATFMTDGVVRSRYEGR